MRNVAHFDSNWPTLKLEKKLVRASPKPKLENYESVQHGLQIPGIKKGAKISFHRHFKIVQRDTQDNAITAPSDKQPNKLLQLQKFN